MSNQTNYARAYFFGGISGCGATLVMHPMDVIRVQIQIDGGKSSLMTVARRIAANQVITSLPRSLSVACVLFTGLHRLLRWSERRHLSSVDLWPLALWHVH